jgi:hypothetical protein
MSLRKTTRPGVITDLSNTKGLTIEPNNQSSKELTALIKERVINGEIDILTVMAFLKKTSKIAKNLMEDAEIKEILLEDFDTLSSQLENKTVLGVKIRSSKSTKTDYSNCNHTELNEIDAIIRQLNYRKKEIQEQLKAIPQGTTQEIVIKKVPTLDTETSGELIEVSPPVKVSKDTIVFTT